MEVKVESGKLENVKNKGMGVSEWILRKKEAIEKSRIK